MSGHFQEFEDEYLETFYEFHEREPGAVVRTGDLAAAMSVSPASVTEMVQRLAAKGYLEYIPYKGAKLSELGLAHGKMMKRRHRLAEVLLSKLPFDGDAHATACRLEHAIDDDLEVALSLLLDSPDCDPSGRMIPDASPHIQERLDNSPTGLRPMTSFEDGAKGSICLMVLSDTAISSLKELGVEVGVEVSKQDGVWRLNDGSVIQMKEIVESKILIRSL